MVVNVSVVIFVSVDSVVIFMFWYALVSRLISSREASIGEQARAGDVAGFGTRQVGDKAGDLIGVAIALKRCDGNQRLREVAVCRIHVSINRAGLDVVNGDAARAEVSGKSLRETRDRSLRKRIDRTADEWHALAVGAANVNDTPAFAQMPRGPPVTSATLPASFFVMFVLIIFSVDLVSCSLNLSFICGQLAPDASKRPIPSCLRSHAFSA